MGEREVIGTMIEVVALNAPQTDKSTNIRKLSPAGVSAFVCSRFSKFLREKKYRTFFISVIIKEVLRNVLETLRKVN